MPYSDYTAEAIVDRGKAIYQQLQNEVEPHRKILFDQKSPNLLVKIQERPAMRKLRTWREYLIKRLAADRGRASGYLQAALEDCQNHGNSAIFLLALQTVVESQGGIAELAKQTGIPPQTLLEMLSGDVLPQIDILVSTLNALGCQVSIQPIEVTNRGPELASEDSSIAPIEAATPGS